MEQFIFSLVLSFLLVHEMDAVRAKEWKMFIILKTMTEETACRVFTGIHLPLYCAACYALLAGPTASSLLKVMLDCFVLGHAILHFAFKKHESNGFKTRYACFLIYAMPALALWHLCLLYMR